MQILHTDIWDKIISFAQKWRKSSEPILILSHANPDGDAIGSTLAVDYILQILGCIPVMVNTSILHDRFMNAMPDANLILLASKLVSSGTMFKAAFIVDCADKSRIGDGDHLLNEDAFIVNIDHHATNDHFGHITLVDPMAASTTFLLAHFWYYLTQKYPQEFALITKSLIRSLYVGILTDTGGFRYRNTMPETLRMAALLMENESTLNLLSEQLIEQKTEPHLRLLGRALLSLEREDQLAWLQILPSDLSSCQAKENDIEGIISQVRCIKGVELAVLFYQQSQEIIRVNFRSKGCIHVGKLAAYFGGGGHTNAAGCIYRGTLTAARDNVLAMAKSKLLCKNKIS